MNTLNTLEFVSAIIKALSWPMVVLICVFLLRNPLSKILTNLNRLSYNNLEMVFEQKLNQLETTLDDNEQMNFDIYQTNNKDLEILTIAQVSPNAAIIMAWALIEHELKNLLNSNNLLENKKSNPLSLINLLLKNELLDNETIATLHDLRELRNTAAHSHQETLSYLQAIKYYELVKKIISILKGC